jgi:hypothetical protein
MHIGIDYSIKSPGMSILDDNGNLHFYCFPRTGVVKEDCLLSLRNSGVNAIVLDNEAALPAKATIAQRERSSLVDAVMQVNAISREIIIHGGRDIAGYSNEETHLGIEGFSFGSKGNRLAQISGYQWLLRYVLYSDAGIVPANFYVYSPMTIKATAGKGNFKKEDMINAFINSEDPQLQATGFWKSIKEDPSQFQTKRGVWLKPIDDIVDSYFVLKTMMNNVEL